MSQLIANARTVTLEPIAPSAKAGTGTGTALYRLPAVSGAGVGIWEVETGVLNGVVGADEVFIVLSGSASLLFEDTGEQVALSAGAVVTLREGQAVSWTVDETLRKIYVNVAA